MVLSEDGKWVAGGVGNLIHVLPTDQANPVPIVLRGHTQEIAGLAFNADDSVLASGSFDQTIRVWTARHLHSIVVARWKGRQ